MPMQEDDDLYIENINSDNERDSNVGSIAYHYMRSHQELQMMRKRKSNMILKMNGLKNKWIFMRIDQKSPLVKKITLLHSWTTLLAIA